MRFLKFINEKEYTFDEITQILQKNCSKYISNTSHERMLYRGVQNATESLLIHYIKKQRQPVNIDKEFHNIINSGFKSIFGVKLRSESFFCTPKAFVAKHYGTLYTAFPSNDYEIYWSPYISDLYAIDIWIDNIYDILTNNNILAFIALYSILHFNARRMR